MKSGLLKERCCDREEVFRKMQLQQWWKRRLAIVGVCPCRSEKRLVLLGIEIVPLFLLLFAASAVTALDTSSGYIDTQQGVNGGHRLVRRLHAPPLVDPRAGELALHCEYDLHGNELYSVSWYRNQQMLFKYQPSLSPPGIDFEVDLTSNQQQQPRDVRVSLSRSNATHLLLLGNQNIHRANPRRYEGTYACEVLIERTFLADYAMANVSAAILPKSNPVIEGLASSYRIGDQLEATCTSAASFPMAELIFHLNGQKVDRRFTKRLKSLQKQRSDTAASSTSLAISVPLERRHFPGGGLKLSCRSVLPGLGLERDYKIERSAKLVSADNQRVAQGLPRMSSSSASCSYRSPVFVEMLLAGIAAVWHVHFP